MTSPADHAATVRECLLRRGPGDYERAALDSLATLVALAELERERDEAEEYGRERFAEERKRAVRAETALRPYMEQHAKAWRDDKRAGECICVMCDAARAALAPDVDRAMAALDAVEALIEGLRWIEDFATRMRDRHTGFVHIERRARAALGETAPPEASA